MKKLALSALVLLVACGSEGGGATPAPGGGAPGGGTSGDGGTGTGTSTGTGGGATCSGLATQKMDDTWTIDSGGVKRTFDVHVPASYDAKTRVPVVLNFHGYSSDAVQEDLLSNMSAKADEKGFVAVHAQGIDASWNAGACCGNAAANHVDDVAFVGAMLDELEKRLCIDDKRVFATGMSNGGFLSHRLACEMSNRIAAVAPVAGVLGVVGCSPSRAVPVMHFHGTADGLVPYDGSPSLGFPSVPDTFAGWAKRDGCTGAPTVSYQKGEVTCSTYAQCAGGSEVTLCTVDSGGHTWPGGTPVPSLGHTTTDIVATDAMWDFFVRHPR